VLLSVERPIVGASALGVQGPRCCTVMVWCEQPMPGWLLAPVSKGRPLRARNGRQAGELVFPFFALPFFRRSRVYRQRQTAALQGPRYLGFGQPMIFSTSGILGRPLQTTASCKRHQWPLQPKPRYRGSCSVFDRPLVCITGPAARPEGCLLLVPHRPHSTLSTQGIVL